MVLLHPSAAIPDHPLSEEALSKVRTELEERCLRAKLEEPFAHVLPCGTCRRGGEVAPCGTRLCPAGTPCSYHPLPPPTRPLVLRKSGREESHGCEILQIREAGEMSSYLCDCISPKDVSNSPCSSRTLPSWSQEAEDGVSRPAAPLPPYLQAALAFPLCPTDVFADCLLSLILAGCT